MFVGSQTISSTDHTLLFPYRDVLMGLQLSWESVHLACMHPCVCSSALHKPSMEGSILEGRQEPQFKAILSCIVRSDPVSKNKG